MKTKEPKNKFNIVWNFAGLTISLESPDDGMNMIEARNKKQIAELAIKALRDTADRIEADKNGIYHQNLGRVLRRDKIRNQDTNQFTDLRKYGEYEETII
jgi:hypothetical protein